MVDRKTFRLVLVQSLKQGLETFDLKTIRESHPVSDVDAFHSCRDVFYSQCLRISDDGKISDSEERMIRQLGERLELSLNQQNECLTSAKNRVFDTELKECLDDGAISTMEAHSLTELRQSLGLASMPKESFGPAEMRLPKIRKRPKKAVAETEDKQTTPSWEGPWGPRSPILGIPYTFLGISGVVCLIAGGVLAYDAKFWPVLAIVLPVLFLHTVIISRCWRCGSNWSMARVDNLDFELFSASRYKKFECCRCGASRTVRNRRRHGRRHRGFF